MKSQNQKTTKSQFFVKATASWKDSSRRKGGYFSYSDITVEDALIEVNGNNAYIYSSVHYYGISVCTKKLSGKYFSCIGKQVTEKTFNKHLAAKKSAQLKFKAEVDARQAAQFKVTMEAAEAKKAAIAAEVASIKVDDQWQADKAAAMQLDGTAKNDAFIAAMKALLSRNGIEKLQYFYQTMKLL